MAIAKHHNKEGKAKQKKAVFLDRDGTINDDPGYVNKAQDFRLLPRVGEAVAKLNRAGFLIVIVTNQSGVARGIIDPKELDRIHERMDELLKKSGAKIDLYKVCTHHPLKDCECRKPKATMLLEAAAQLDVDLSQSFMVGDRISDLVAGKNAKVKGVGLVRSGHGLETEKDPDAKEHFDFIGDSLFEVVEWILGSVSV